PESRKWPASMSSSGQRAGTPFRPARSSSLSTVGCRVSQPVTSRKVGGRSPAEGGDVGADHLTSDGGVVGSEFAMEVGDAGASRGESASRYDLWGSSLLGPGLLSRMMSCRRAAFTRFCLTSRTFYDRKRSEGMSHKQAILASPVDA